MKALVITVEQILDKLEAGEDIDDILQDWPHLTREGIMQATAYARQLVHQLSAEPSRSENKEFLLSRALL